MASIPNDPLFDLQWHLHNPGGLVAGLPAPPGIDINWLPVWQEYTGNGVSVGIYDDMDSVSHPDFPAPASFTDFVNHALAVLSLIFGSANNGSGGAGIAPRVAPEPIKIPVSATGGYVASLPKQDVNNFSWQWDILTGKPTFTTISTINSGTAVQAYLDGYEAAADEGRGSLGGIALGSIVCIASGNQREHGAASRDPGTDHETILNYRTSSDYTVVVGAVGIDGYVPKYSTPGANLLVSAPSGTYDEADGQIGGILAADEPGPGGNGDGDYITDFDGTSASAPMVSGVVALMLEANPDLGWRDVQDILAYSARAVGTLVYSDEELNAGNEKYDWIFNAAKDWNGGGLHFSNDYGFGLLDAHAAVRLAETWTASSTSANYVSFSETSPRVLLGIPDNDAAGATLQLTFEQSENVRIDYVSLYVDMFATHRNMGDLVFTLISPSGTEHVLAANAGSFLDFNFHTLMDAAFRGETSAGAWTVRIADTVAGNHTGTPPSIDFVRLTVKGDAVSKADTYVYTNEFSDWSSSDPDRKVLIDENGGIDAINAAAVTRASKIDLNAGKISKIDGVTLTIDGGTRIENAYGGDGKDNLIGNSAANVLWGGLGNDKVDGGVGKDRLEGGAGKDRLDGGSGNDTVNGGEGGDTITGGAGRDRLYGGADANRFLFATIQEVGTRLSAADVIEDFEAGDRIVLKAIDARAQTAADDAFSFLARAKFTEEAGELRYQKKGGFTVVEGDVSGDGRADFSLKLTAAHTLQAGDFLL